MSWRNNILFYGALKCCEAQIHFKGHLKKEFMQRNNSKKKQQTTQHQ